MITKSIGKMAVIEVAYKKDHEDMDEFLWLLKAREKSNEFVNPVYHCVMVDDEYIMCADTKRMHIIPNTLGIVAGVYDVCIVSRKKICLMESNCCDISHISQYRAVIPDVDKMDILNRTTKYYFSTMAKIYSKLSMRSVLIGINEQYIKDAVFRNDENTIYGNLKTDEATPFLVKSSKRMAVIMPILLKD
jgi:hypothetical protein